MKYERPEEIERQLERDRAAIEDTIEAIQRRLSPGQLLDQTLGYVRSGGSEVATSVARSAQQNPWPLIITGVGLAWLMQSTASSRRNGEHYGGHERSIYEFEPAGRGETFERMRAAAAAVQRQAGEAEHAFQERVTEAKARVVEMRRDAGETAEAFRQRVEDYIRRAEETATRLRDRAGSAVDRGTQALGQGARAVRSGARSAQSRARELYAAEPLVAGALAVAAGALLGALLPATRTENRLLGEYAGRMREKATEVAEEAKERSKAAAVAGARAAAEAAEDAVTGGNKEAGPSQSGRTEEMASIHP